MKLTAPQLRRLELLHAAMWPGAKLDRSSRAAATCCTFDDGLKHRERLFASELFRVKAHRWFHRKAAA